MNPVVHFEISNDNRQRMVKLYKSVFGWHTQMLVQEMDDNGPKNSSSINGFFRKPDWPAQYPSVVIAVDSVNDAIKKSPISEVAHWAIRWKCPESVNIGTEGNRVSLLHPHSAQLACVKSSKKEN